MGGVRRVAAAWGVVLVMVGAWGLGGCTERAPQAPNPSPSSSTAGTPSGPPQAPNTPPSNPNPSNPPQGAGGGLGAAKTALVVVALDPSGGVKVQGVKVKPTLWGAQTTPFDAKRHLPGAEVEVEEPHGPTQGQAPDPTQGQAPAQGVGAGTQAGPSDPSQGAPHEDHEGHDHFHEPAVVVEDPKAPWVLALVVEHPSLPAPWVVEQRLDPPGSSSGDVVNPFEAGGATWKAPWPGEGAKIKVVRVAPRGPALLGTWGTR